jgi:hypothetical protein
MENVGFRWPDNLPYVGENEPMVVNLCIWMVSYAARLFPNPDESSDSDE